MQAHLYSSDKYLCTKLNTTPPTYQQQTKSQIKGNFIILLIISLLACLPKVIKSLCYCLESVLLLWGYPLEIVVQVQLPAYTIILLLYIHAHHSLPMPGSAAFAHHWIVSLTFHFFLSCLKYLAKMSHFRQNSEFLSAFFFFFYQCVQDYADLRAIKIKP